WDTRVGTIELAIPKLRAGSYFPDWLLQPRRRAGQAFVSVIADAYLAGGSTRRVEKLVQQLRVQRMSRSPVSRLAKSLDTIVEDFRSARRLALAPPRRLEVAPPAVGFLSSRLIADRAPRCRSGAEP